MNPPPAGPDLPTEPEAPTAPSTAPGRAAAAIALAVAVGLVAAATLGSAGAWGGGTAPVGAAVGRPVTLAAVETYDDLPTTHTDEPVTYDQRPAVGGPHAGAWLDCGTYDEPVREENVVHDLEHGTVWFAVQDDLDAQARAELAALLPGNGILSPYPGLDAPLVVTVWGAQLRLSGPDDPRLPLFLERYGNAQTAPEPMASCDGGLSDPSGGTPTTTAV